MSQARTDKVRIFVSSPGDVQRERDQLDKVVQELNSTLAALVPERGLVLELWRWETDAHPGYGMGGPQNVIDRQAPIADFDIFIGIMWRRFGTPTEQRGSGTEEEFHAARQGWRANRRPREILFYFCEAPHGPGTVAETEQELKVARFREELTKEMLVGAYPDHSAFADQVRPHLVRVISRILRPGEAPSESAERAAQLTPSTDLEVTRRQLRDMAHEYETLRATMDAGAARTRKMEVVASRMRALALSAYPLLPELMASSSPGEHLSAVTTLQALPRADYLQWLAGLIPVEKPFIQYHAAVALLNAARTLEVADLPKVREAVAVAKGRAAELRRDPDRDTTLQYAEKEVARRLASAQG